MIFFLQCWDLADQAIKEVTIQLKDETRGEFPGLCEAIEHAFGEVQYVNIDGDIGWGIERKVRRGDVLQFVVSLSSLASFPPPSTR